MCLRAFSIKTSLLMITLALSIVVCAQTESTLYTFKESTSFWPQGALLEDAAGNLYGTTRAGGTYGVGTIFKMTPPAVSGGAWTLATLYNFVPYGSGGYVPVSDLITDSTGASLRDDVLWRRPGLQLRCGLQANPALYCRRQVD